MRTLRSIPLSTNKPWLLFAVICGGLISANLVFGSLVYGATACDFGIIWRAAHARQIYAHDHQAPFVYPPTALVWIRPLRFVPFWAAFFAWTGASAAALYSVTRKPLLFVSPIVLQGLLFGQPTLLLASLILARRWSGFLMGVAVSIKPQLLFMVPLVLAWRGQFRTLSAVAAGAVGSLAISVLLFGAQPWVDWLHAIPNLRDVMSRGPGWSLTVTPYGAAARFGINPYPAWAVGVLLGVAVAIKSKGDPIFVAALASLLASPYAFVQDLIVLLPFCLARLDRKGDPAAAFLFAAAVPPITLVGLALRDLWLNKNNRGKLAAGAAAAVVDGLCEGASGQQRADARHAGALGVR